MEQSELAEMRACPEESSPLIVNKRKYLNRFPNVDTIRKVLGCEDEGELSRILAASRFDPQKIREMIHLYKTKCESAGKRIPISSFASSQEALDVFGCERTPSTVKHKKRPNDIGNPADRIDSQDPDTAFCGKLIHIDGMVFSCVEQFHVLLSTIIFGAPLHSSGWSSHFSSRCREQFSKRRFHDERWA